VEEGMQNFDQVQRAYDELLRAGEIYSTSEQLIIEGQKAYLTRRAAYYLNLINPDLGLLSKITGNNVMGLSTDIVVKHNGDFYDIATDVATGDNNKRLVQPVNAGIDNDPLLASKWIQPTKELAGLTDILIPTPTPIPVPIPVPSNDYQKILDTLADIANLQLDISNTIHLNQSEIMSKLDMILNKPITITFPDYKSSGWLTITLSPVKK
jgi:hypothetical protein